MPKTEWHRGKIRWLLPAGAVLVAGAIWLATQRGGAGGVADATAKTPARPQVQKAVSSTLIVRPPQRALVHNPQCGVPAVAEMVRCGMVSLSIPADAVVVNVVRKVRETGDEVPHSFWIEDDGAYRGCRLRPGWCAAEAIKHVKAADKQTLSYGVKNWKFDRDREFLLEVHYTQPGVGG